jgi:hypothetical protein
MPDWGTIWPGMYMTFDLVGVDAQTWALASVSVHADLVKRGVRPVAEVVIRNHFQSEAMSIIRHAGLRTHAAARGRNHVALYLYRHKYLGAVIRSLLGSETSFDDDTLQIWHWGKLFGYSDEAIGRFCREQQAGRISQDPGLNASKSDGDQL